MEDLSIQVLNGYGVKAKNIRKNKLTYICNTDKGTRAIKSTILDHNKINFIHTIKEHLHEKGFDSTDRFYKSTASKPYFTFGGKTYVMTDYIEGSELDFSDNEKTRDIIRQVACMHKFSKGIRIGEENGRFAESDDLLTDYSKKITRLTSIKKTVNTKSHLSDFDVMFIKNYDYLLTECKEAVSILEHSQYKALREKASAEKYVCHNALKEENILFGTDKIYITNFSEGSIDPHIIDLAEFIIRYVRKHPEQYLKIGDIIETYDQVNPIAKPEVEILYGLLKFPNKIVKVCNNYYTKRRSWAPSSIVNRFESLIGIKDHHKEYIDEIKSL